jgi:ribosome biogenesis GTPase
VEPPAPTLAGTVFRILGKEVSVRVPTRDGPRTIECYLRGRLFGEQRSETSNQLVVGDSVELDAIEPMVGEGPFRGVIHGVRPRRTALVRRVGGRKPRIQVLAANLDQLVVVSAIVDPPYKTGLIDRYLVIAHHAGISPSLCLNKIDLGDETALRKADQELGTYRSIGYSVVLTSAKSGTGLPELQAILKGKRSVLAGHSGVGKSKLAAAIQPGIRLSSADVDRHGRGRHATTASTLFTLDFGGELVDTPGVRELSIRQVERNDLARCFLDFRPFLERCHFTSCSHIPEPHCAVKEATEGGSISRARYESYVRLYEELS